MTKEECIADLKSINATGMECIDYAIKALEQPTSNDYVSRQAVLNTLFYKSDNNCEVVLNKELQDRIKDLPPVTPTRKVGKWEESPSPSGSGLIGYKCSSCGKFYPLIEGLNYCPNCGSKVSEITTGSTSNDCISRQAVDRLCFEYLKPNTDDNIAFYEHFLDLPPVTPTFPNGATNGDMIKAMFDCQEDENQWYDGSIWVTFRAKNNPSHNFDLDWWNAPYKRGNEE